MSAVDTVGVGKGLLRGVALQQGVHRLARRDHRSLPGPVDRPAGDARSAQTNAQAVAAAAVTDHQTEQTEQAQLEQAKAQLADEQRRWQLQAREELAREREACLQQARTAGEAQGQAQGLEQVREQWQQRLARLDALIDRLGGLLGQQLEGAEDLAVAIAYESVLKVLGEAVATPQGVRAVVQQAIAGLRQREQLVVRVPAEDYQLLSEHLPGDHPLARPGIEIQPDAQLADGGCVIHTEAAGRLDARLSTQLASLRSVLLQARAKAHATAR